MINQIREYLKRPLIAGIVGLVVGLIFGLFVLGWLVWPVQWIDASPVNLHPGWQDRWLQMAIISYHTTGDASAAKLEFEALGNDASDAMTRVQLSPGNIDPAWITQFQDTVGSTGQVQPATAAPGVTPTAAPSAGAKFNTTTLLVVMCVIMAVAIAGIVLYFVLQNRKRMVGGAAPAVQAPEPELQTPAEWTAYQEPAEHAPMAQFMASYKTGDDMFDDSFSID